MSYTISYQADTARVDYAGETTVEEIKDAHSEISEDMRFYECHHLILDVRDCNLSGVSVPELSSVVVSDLWASRRNKSLKVAFLIQSLVNMERTSEFINESRISPWEWRQFESEERAMDWFRAEA